MALKRDENRVKVLGGVTDDSNQTVQNLIVNPTNKRLKVSATVASGIVTSINADNAPAQTITVGTTGTDVAIVDNGTGDHKINIPTASAVNRGALSSADWSTFNAKQPAGSYEVTTNKDTDGTLAANSDIKYASQKAIKTYADTKVATNSNASLLDASYSKAAGNARYTTLKTGTSTRWELGANATAESGGNAGSDLVVNRYNDAGVYVDSPLIIARSSGVITPSAAIAGSITGNAGTVTGATFTKNLTVNGGNTTITGNADNTSALTVGSGAVSVSGTNTGDQTSVSGSSGSCTGNSATATKLAATKMINGTAFDGSADIINNFPRGFLINGKIVPSVAANNLTLAIKGSDGNDPSATNPVYCRIGDTIRSITAALSVTKNAGTNWFNAGSSELATKEIDYFVYLGYNATDGVVIGFARIIGEEYDSFSATTTNEKYCAISNITTAAAGDDYENIGRFAATLSAGAGYTWSVPTFTNKNLIQRPIYETRWLDWLPTYSCGGSMTYTGVNTTVKYRIRGRECYLEWFIYGTTGGSASSTILFTFPIGSVSYANVYTSCMTFDGSGLTGYMNLTAVNQMTISKVGDGAWGIGASKYIMGNVTYQI